MSCTNAVHEYHYPGHRSNRLILICQFIQLCGTVKYSALETCRHSKEETSWNVIIHRMESGRNLTCDSINKDDLLKRISKTGAKLFHE